MSGPRLLTGPLHARRLGVRGQVFPTAEAFKKPPTATFRSSQLKPRDYTLRISRMLTWLAQAGRCGRC
jgi:hypothetical protein